MQCSRQTKHILKLWSIRATFWLIIVDSQKLHFVYIRTASADMLPLRMRGRGGSKDVGEECGGCRVCGSKAVKY